MDSEIRKRLAEVRRETPEGQAWFVLLDVVLRELVENADEWSAAAPRSSPDRPPGAPCLHGAEIVLDGRVARRWVGRLLTLARDAEDEGAASLARLKTRRLDALAMLEAAVRQQDDRVDAIAAEAGADHHALRVVGQMAALPLLQATGRALEREVTEAWWEGYCPTCGAWPAWAEFRGLDRKRWLRCGRCGTAWQIAWLRCPFCNETHHERLGYLTPEEGQDNRKVEVCRTCKGYVKAFATVSAAPPWAVLLDDFATVHLDLAAIEQGYARPQRPGYPLDVRIHDRRRGWFGVSSARAARRPLE